MTNEIKITDNFMFATVMKGESINVIRIRNSYNFRPKNCKAILVH